MVCHVSCEEACIIKGPWTPDEDSKLILHIRNHGEGSWPDVPRKAGLRRCSKSCRLRWRNYLRPDVKRGNYSEAEEDMILKLHAIVGNRWSLIARHLPGRTDNGIKNLWNTRMKKKLRRMGIDPETHGSIGPAKTYAQSPMQFGGAGFILPQGKVPAGKTLQADSAPGHLQSLCYSVQSGLQISSEDCSTGPSGDSIFFAGVPHGDQMYAELNRHQDRAIRAEPAELREQSMMYHHYVPTDIDLWRHGHCSASSALSEHFLAEQTEQISYYDSVASNSGSY